MVAVLEDTSMAESSVTMTDRKKALAPRPWRVDRETARRHPWADACSIVDADGGTVCWLTRGYQGDAAGDACPSWDNAEMIVAAVNAFGNGEIGRE